MWTGAFTSTSGYFVQEVAQSWLVYTLTDSPFLLGLTAFLNGAPILLLSLFGGVAADRMDRRKILAVSQYIQMLAALILAALLWFDVIEVWHIMAAALMNGLGQAFGGPAYQALIPSLVDKKDLPNAVALMSIQFNLASVIGRLIGGLVFAAVGAAACFAINAITFVPVIVVLYFIHVSFIPKKAEVDVWQSLKDGVGYVFRDAALSSLMLLSLGAAFLAIPMMTLLPVFARETFHLGAQGYSLMGAVFGAGAVLGALFVAWLGNMPNKGRRTLLMQLVLGAAMMAFALSGNLWVALFFAFLTGGAVLGVFAMINSLVQQRAPDELRGRIMSVQNTAFRGAMPLGNLAAGSLAGSLGAPVIVALNGAALGLIAVWYLLRGKAITRL
jgi:MFS family permease